MYKAKKVKKLKIVKSKRVKLFAIISDDDTFYRANIMDVTIFIYP